MKNLFKKEETTNSFQCKGYGVCEYKYYSLGDEFRNDFNELMKKHFNAKDLVEFHITSDGTLRFTTLMEIK